MIRSLSEATEKFLQKEFGLSETDVPWEIVQNLEHGDFATNIALRLGKQLGKSPKEIADAIASHIGSLNEIEKAEIAGPGYVNVWLKPEAFNDLLAETVNALSPLPERKEDPVIIEYSQPNIAKPLGIHHIIGTAIGQSLVNIYRHMGYPVISWNYIGDWGTQFGKLAVAYELWGNGKPVKDHSLEDLLALYVKFHNEAEKDDSLENKGREAFKKLEDGDAELRTFWEDVVSVTKASLADTYERLHVSFNLDLGESFYQGKMDSILDEGKKKKIFVEGKEGALIVEFSEESGMPPYLVQKGDGATLYSTRDIAQMRYRIDTYHPSAIYILTDIAQKLHFEQLVETCNRLGWKLPTFENVLFGRMRFTDKSMSTRKGNILNLREVLDEAVERADAIIKERGDSIQTDDPKELGEMMGTGALVYGILSQNRKMDIVFDWDKMLSFDGNSAPYLQYTHARAASVLRKAEHVPQKISATSSLTQHERSLIHLLIRFPHVLQQIVDDRLPHKLANYLYDLCQTFNAFYNADSILQAENDQKAFRLSLTSLTASVLRTGATLLTLRVPDRM